MILEEGDKILITVFFRGREQAHKEIGKALMERIKKDLEDISKVEHDVTMQGPRMQITLLPKPPTKPKAPPTAGTPVPVEPAPAAPSAAAPAPGPAPAPSSAPVQAGAAEGRTQGEANAKN